MARFGRDFVRAATQPAFTQGLFTAAQQIGSAPARRREEQQQQAKRALETQAQQALLSKDYPNTCLLYTSPSPRDRTRSRMPSSA